MIAISKVDRRGFLKTGAAAAGGLLVGFSLPDLTARAAGGTHKLNAWVHVGSDDLVTLYIHKAEMGQGTVTSLSMLLAEELECDWTKIRTEFPGINPEYGPNQGVVGSQSIRSSWEPLRRAGATARGMLTAAAAAQWGVDRSSCRAENSVVVNALTNERLSYGSLAEAAAKLPPSADVPLKDPQQFRLVGTSQKRIDTPEKVNGSAVFGIDVRVPGMLHAVVARCPVFGGTVVSFDAAKAKAVSGVKQVVQISTGVAVVADNTWSAIQGRRALEITWDEGKNATLTTSGISKMFAERAQQDGLVARRQGDAAAALAAAARKVDAVYEAPYLAHAPMEPLNCVADVRADSCQVWASTQGQTSALNAAVAITGLKPDQVQVHTRYMGGGFGRRARADYISEAVEVSKAAKVPVQVTWTREDDIQQDFYRPASYTRLIAGLDGDGWPVAWTARVVCPPFGNVREGIANTAIDGVANIVYDIPHIFVDYHPADPGIPVSFWRSVGYSQNTFFTESFVDELAAAGGKDPLSLRRRLLAKVPRMLGALDLAAEKAGWGAPLPPGRARGLSVVNNIGSFTAQVAEVSVSDGRLRVHRVVCAIDCGHVVNPAIVRQQIESAIVYGLAPVLKDGITIDRGRVQQSNFHDYEVLRLPDMPAIDVHIVPSRQNPGGVGEAATPGIAPAVANAIYAATGKRIRRLPLRP